MKHFRIGPVGMRGIVGSTVALLSLALAGSALAHPPSTVTITSTIDVTGFPPPNTQTYSGSYNTSAGDSGTTTVQALYAAVPSPTVSVFQSVQTLNSNDGSSTLVLRCHQLATAEDFSTFPSVPSSGSCAVISGTGAYAGLSGSGALTGLAHFDAATLTQTVSLGG